MPFSLRQVCLWSSVWLPTGNQACCCSHGLDNPASVPCRCGHHPGSAGVVCREAWVALRSRWDVIYTCVEQKTSCPQFEFVFVCVLLYPPKLRHDCIFKPVTLFLSLGTANAFPAALKFSSHSQISKAHSPSTINRLSCVLSLSASQLCETGE